jgi:carbamoyl-phosphate synthase large subunit
MNFFNSKTQAGKTVLLLGSGGLRIGQAGEFDYSGSQAIKALKEEGIRVILVNPNIATVQTDPDFVDQLYLQPLELNTVRKIIAKERPDALMLGFGGQTALNLGLALDEAGVLAQYEVDVLGTSLKTIRLTEDRDLFKTELATIGIKTPRSFCVETIADAVDAAQDIGYPIMMRSGFTLGGLGSGRIDHVEQLQRRVKEALVSAPHVLIEEYLLGWKEFEYEVVRDIDDNALTICNMENLDPMGVHTGESVVVAPSQTLSNKEFHHLRALSIKIARHVGILGECNVQFAVNPENGDYRVIEMNARLSRSSALASKATGYPLAFVATKLALRFPLHQIKNSITQKTSAMFEPALDYVVVKIPRWDTHKLRASERTIGTEMKSVGEVMAIGRSFPEALQKAIGMLNLGASCLCDYPYCIENAEHEVQFPTDRRLFSLVDFFRQGGTVSSAHALSKINPWFLHHIKKIVQFDIALKHHDLNKETVLKAKQLGFSDKRIAQVRGVSEQIIRAQRIGWGVTPVVKQIDTLAGEFPAQTNYLYMTYHGNAHDIEASASPPVIVLGSGPYSIGSSVEFDWCAVTTARTLKKHGVLSIMINANPETVSTDYDESDRLYFEQLSFERVQDIAEFEQPRGIIVSVGGQVANNLAVPLQKAGQRILGTSPDRIHMAENRKIFSSLLNELSIDQPRWAEVTSLDNVLHFVRQVGFPVLIRPSYVLSGAAMNVVFTHAQLQSYLQEASSVSQEHPVVISEFIQGAKELEVDGVASDGQVVIEAISEHVENAGVHSGDATIVIPPQGLYLETIRRTKHITRQVIKALQITGPFNIQFIAKHNTIRVIECNVRASRSFPFVSKVVRHNLIRTAVEVMLGVYQPVHVETLELDYVGVKAPQFSYHRLKGSNPVAHVEMASTGEVGVLGDDLLDAFYHAWLATDQTIRGKRLFISIGGKENKLKLLGPIANLDRLGFDIFATEGTHDFLSQNGIGSLCLYKASQRIEPNVVSYVSNQRLDFIVNLPSGRVHEEQASDGYHLRRLAVDHHIPLMTNLQQVQLMFRALAFYGVEGRERDVKSYDDFLHADERSSLLIEEKIKAWQFAHEE